MEKIQNPAFIISHSMKRHTYILRCADDTLYTGITTDLERRVQEHNHSHLGASYTRGRRPVTLVRSQAYPSRSESSKAEYRIKHLSKKEKQALINQ